MTKQIHISPKIGKVKRQIERGDKPSPCVIIRHVSTDEPERWERGYEAIIYGQDGLEAARIVFRPYTPLPPGITCWVETVGEVELVTEYSTGSAE